MDYTSDAYLDWLHRLVDMVSGAQRFLMLALLGLLFARFVAPFLTSRPKRYAYGCGFGYFLLYALLNFLPEEAFPQGFYFILYLSFGFLLLYLAERRNPLQKLFLSMAFHSLNSIFVIMASDQNGILSDVLYKSQTLNRTPEATIGLFVFSTVEYLLFYSAGMCIGIHILHKAYRYKQDVLGLRDFLILSIPTVFCRLQIMMYLHEYTMFTDYFQELADNHQEEVLASMSWSSGLRFFDYGAAFAFLVVYVWLYFDLKRQYKERLAESVRLEQETQLAGHVRQMEQMYGEMQGLRHDMSHHVMVLSGLVERQDWENASQYLSRIGNEVSDIRPAIATGHPVTDVILSETKREAERMGIVFDCDFQFPADSGLDVFDISILLGNALRNAVEGASFGGAGMGGSLAIGNGASSATEMEKNGNGDSLAIAETPFIAVRSFVKHNMYLIEVKNSFHGAWEIDRDSGFPLSAKPGERHGIGLYNMRSIAQKYRGDISLEKKDGTVEFVALVQMGDGQ